MNTKKTRGRPRRFDPDQAVETAQRLFHAHGYDAVTVADITEALGINPPSFYAAFGSKAGLFARAISRYNAGSAIPFSDLLRPDRPVAESLATILKEAARIYAADPDTTGCLVLEGTRSNDPDARETARGFQAAAEEMIREYIAEQYPEKSERVTDFVSTVMVGLSAKARRGHALDRLLATVDLASLALAEALPEEAPDARA
ncbi:TetR/AcrR family transcriptional regulator [Halodurantibacterium flavum]|uniref:TetR/AcrR family transcriptional regulator n=1 Tax=Halodurantibacterium flavum TaxID=1382802 RepID=A0ABW4RZL4_9RHOB